MGISVLTVSLVTLFWTVLGFSLSLFVIRNGPNKSLLQVTSILTAVSCWLFWICCYMSQMNPLIGPRLNNHTLLLIARQWDNK